MTERRRTFVGIGFGPIQAGLFLTEAYRAGSFGRLVVAEIVPEVVAAVRAAGGFTVNIGHADHIETLTVAPVEVYNPAIPEDRAVLVAAIAEADELATALPSVATYTAGGDSSAARLLADGLEAKARQNGPLAVIYAAENHTRAADLLESAVLAAMPMRWRDQACRRVQLLDTIIGKMSGAPETAADLPAVAPGLERRYLVEAFNRILISQIRRPGPDAPLTDPAWADYVRGIQVFSEKSQLAPFAEAKLYGHNAGHALAGYLADLLGFVRIDQLQSRPDVIEFVRQAMRYESGMPLCRRYADVDPLFTPQGFAAYANDLIVRMLNPFVRDTVARVGRDPARKLGWDDRLIGAMRLALAESIEPRRYALGAAAALETLAGTGAAPAAVLTPLWEPALPDPGAAAVILARIEAAQRTLRAWVAGSCLELQ